MRIHGLLRRWATTAALAFATALAAHAQFVVTTTNSSAITLDGSSATRDFVINWGDLPALGTILDISLTLDFAKGDASSPASPAYADEIGVKLSHGAFSLQVIANGQWAPDDGYFSGAMTFNDAAATPSWMLTGPATGTYQGWDLFAPLIGTPLSPGVWTLSLEDTLTGAPLEFRSATLSITGQPVPEPATYGALGVGALALFILIRHRVRR